MITRFEQRYAWPFLAIRIHRADQAEIDTHAPPFKGACASLSLVAPEPNLSTAGTRRRKLICVL